MGEKGQLGLLRPTNAGDSPYRWRNDPRKNHSGARNGAYAVMFEGRHTPSPRLIRLGAFAGTSALNYAFALAMGWLLEPGEYGLLTFTQMLSLLGGMVMGSAFAFSLARAVVRRTERERDALVRGTLLANLVPALAMNAVFLALFAAGPLRKAFERWFVVAVVALCFPLIPLIHTMTGFSEGFGRFDVSASLSSRCHARCCACTAGLWCLSFDRRFSSRCRMRSGAWILSVGVQLQRAVARRPETAGPPRVGGHLRGDDRHLFAARLRHCRVQVAR